MSGFPSINEILPPNKSGKKKSSGTQSAFTAKMDEIELKEKEQSIAAEAAQMGVQYIDLIAFPVSSEALKSIPEKDAVKLKIVCFYFSTAELRVGGVELNEDFKNYLPVLEEKFHAKIIPYKISEHSFEHVLKLYETLPIIKPISKDIVITDEELSRFGVSLNDLQSVQAAFERVTISDVLTLMIAAALRLNASDVHIEAEEKGVAVRYRVDGILHDVANLPREEWKKFVSRIKLLAALKINVSDRPQDGRATLKLSDSSLDVRVSTMPTFYGESVVLRILNSSNNGVTFDQLGLRGEAYLRLKREVERPNGMIVTTGPTGSGKTTTLYAIMRTLNKPGVKIITLEDPIEIKMDGLNQSQVDPGRDYTFAKGLRSLLRQDPDICMVGEIRDLETAEISIQAALTGHLMLSTIHTNSASAAVPRFLSMGVKPFLLAPAMNSIMGQRLVRRLCENCRDEVQIDPEKMERVMKVLETLPPAESKNVDLKNLHFYEGKGCKECSGLGYKGRIGIYEIFTMDKEVEEEILSGKVSEYLIQELAVKNGMVTMVQDGILKALDKITSVTEVFRVIE